MRIKTAIYLTSTGFGGLEMNLINLAKWLKESNHPILFVVQNNTRLSKKIYEQGFDIEYVNEPGRFLDIASALTLSRILKKWEVKHVVIGDNRNIDCANLCKKLFFRSLNLIYFQQMHFKVNKKDLVHNFRFSGLNWWIAPLEKNKKEVLNKTSLTAEKIKILPLAVDVDKFILNKIPKSKALSDLVLNEEKEYIGILGRIAPTKGQLFLIKAFAEISMHHKNLDLVIMGEPTINEPQCLEYFEDSKRFITDVGIENRVHWLPFSEQVQSFYGAISCFVMASENETFGMVTVEAMLSGIPVIGTNSGGTAEILEHGKYGQLVAYMDVNGLKTAINRVINEREKYQKIATKAQDMSRSRFDKSSLTEGVLKLLN